MPYVQIKCYPKDEETKKKVIDKINEAFLEIWGCPAEAITISLEEVEPSEWDSVIKNDIEPNYDKLYIESGKIRC